MYKLFLTFLLCSSISIAGVINGVALTVNDDPITLFDVDQTMVKKANANFIHFAALRKAVLKNLQKHICIAWFRKFSPDFNT